MFDLREYRSRPAQLSDYLPWAALVGPGVVLNKDGAFQRTARFRGPDLESATDSELVSAAGRLNNALRRLGSGWAIFVEAQRNACAAYPVSDFPDPVSALVEAERRAQFEAHGTHFDSAYFLSFVFLPPAEQASRMQGLFFEGREARGPLEGAVLVQHDARTNQRRPGQVVAELGGPGAIFAKVEHPQTSR